MHGSGGHCDKVWDKVWDNVRDNDWDYLRKYVWLRLTL